MAQLKSYAIVTLAVLMFTAAAAVMGFGTGVGSGNYYQSADAAKDSKGCGSGSQGDTSSGGKCVKGPKSNNGGGDDEPTPTPN
jgi:hypothetical protein